MRQATEPIRSGERPIATGSAYGALFPRADHRDRTLVRNGDVGDTLDLMQRVVWTYRDDTRRLAPMLQQARLEDTCRAVWEFIYRHIQYRLDKKGLEQLRRPARTWSERRQGVDCDCMSIFASSVLLNLGIPHSFRVTRYAQPHWQHVYVIVPKPGGGHHTIDAVLSRFDYEKPYTDKMDYPMDMKGIDVAVLSGPGEWTGQADSGTFAYHNLLDTRKALSLDPALYTSVQDAAGLAEMLDYALRYFHTDRRDAALAVLAQQEELLNAQNGIYPIEGMGMDTEDEVLGTLGARNYFRCIQAACRPCPSRAHTAIKAERQPRPILHLTTAAMAYPAYQGVLPLLVATVPGTVCKAPTAVPGTVRRAPVPVPATTATIPIPSPALHTQPTMAQTNQAPKGVKKAVQGTVKAVVKFNPVSIAARNGYLLALKLNLGGMAGKLKWAYATQPQAAAMGVSPTDWQKSRTALARVERLFADRLQGSRDALRNAILKGKAGGLGNPGLGEGITAAAIAAAAPLIIATLNILKEAGLIDPNFKLDLDNLEARAQEALQEDPAVTNTLPAMEPTTTSGGAVAWAKANPLPAIAIAAGIGYLAYNALAGPGQKRPKGRSLSGLPKPRRRKGKKSKAPVRTVLIR